MKKSLSVVSLCALVIVQTNAQERVYTTIDAQGRIQILKSEVAEPKVNVDADVSTQKPNNPPVSSKDLPQKHEYEGEEYIDAEAFEQKQATQKPKNRFYYVPTGALGEKVVESEAGVAASSVKTLPEPVKQTMNLSSDYQELSKEWLLEKQAGLQQYCQQSKKLKPIQPFKASNALWINKAAFVSHEPDKILRLDNILLTDTTIKLSSFANSHKKPMFYLPMVVFLDENGCVLEGAWHYWSQARAANDKQYSALDGLLTIPMGSKYILLYPPNEAWQASLPLQNYGALLLEK